MTKSQKIKSPNLLLEQTYLELAPLLTNNFKIQDLPKSWSPGKLTSVLHLFENKNLSEALWKEVQKYFNDFWRQERPIRERSYEPTMRAFGLRSEFAKTAAQLAPQGKRVLLVEYGAATGHQSVPMLKAFKDKNPESEFAAILTDIDPEIEAAAQANLNKIPDLVLRKTIIADFSQGLPKKVKAQINKFNPDTLVFYAFYSITYQPLDRLKQLVIESLDFAKERQMLSSMQILTLNPDFQPQKLGEIFQTQIAPRLSQTDAGRRIVKEAKEAFSESIPHGARVTQTMPIYPRGSISRHLAQSGLKIVEREILHGHSDLLSISLN